MKKEKDNLNTPVSDTETPKQPTLKEILKAEEAEERAKRKAERLKKKQKVAYDHRGNIIPDLNKKHVRGIESKKSTYGFMFVLPWIIGMILFFFVPLLQSLIYSFSYVVPDIGELSTEWVGLDNYKYIFQQDQYYVDNLMKSLSGFFTTMPIIVILSLILALVLNGEFKGRIVFRGIFFIPVIVATGVVMSLLSQSYANGPIIQLSTTVTEDAYSAIGTGSGMDFTTLLNSLKLPEDVTAQLNTMITGIFNTLWSCGIPVVLFIAGLQTIPAQLYEVSKVEGATKWEEFWYITLPMIGQTLLLVIVFTLIEVLTQNSNAVITQAYDQMISNMNYSDSAAMLWTFFGIVGGATGLIILLYSKLCLKRWE